MAYLKNVIRVEMQLQIVTGVCERPDSSLGPVLLCLFVSVNTIIQLLYVLSGFLFYCMDLCQSDLIFFSRCLPSLVEGVLNGIVLQEMAQPCSSLVLPMSKKEFNNKGSFLLYDNCTAEW